MNSAVPIKTERRYKHPKITLCYKCAGSGIYSHMDENDRNEVSETCPDCNGSGRLVVSGVVEVTLQPYVPGTMLYRQIRNKV